MGKSALVTGASYGLGAATALALARDGYDVAITATRLANLTDTRAKLEAAGARLLPLALDVCAQTSIDQTVDAVLAAFGGIDVLVNNAGVTLRRFALDVTRAEWDTVMETNITGTFFLTQRVGRWMIENRRPGAIVNVASTHGFIGAPERSTYGISKGALIQMTRLLAIEWAEHGIRVNAVAPGRLLTASPSRQETASDPKYMEAMLRRIPLGRFATVEEVAGAIAYLAGPLAGSVTGQTLALDGGLTTA